jgi:predicted MFS family arabinose efflux permease
MTHVGTNLTSAPIGSHSLVTIVGFLVCVELASGILQGYYTPIFSDIADHLDISDADVNWFEAAQLIVSALAVPVLARLGDMVGAKYVLLLSTAITAVGSWVLAFAPSFTTFLIGWALQGRLRDLAADGGRHRLPPDGRLRTSEPAHPTRRGILVGALELAVIIGALTSGAIVESTSMTVVLMLPAIVVTVCFFLILFGIERDPGRSGGTFDLIGFLLITDVIGLVMAGLITIRLQGADSPLAWILIALGLASLAPFIIYESRHEEPIIDVRLFASRLQWPVQLTAFLFGMSVLGAQIPLSTFARTDPDVAGYGLGADAAFVSTLIGVYVVFLAVGAFSLPLTTRIFGPRGALIMSSLLVALGYALWLPFHDSTTQALVNMAVVGVGPAPWSRPCPPAPPRVRRPSAPGSRPA